VQTFASIRDRPTWIQGLPQTGWSGADPSEPGAKQLEFNFDITDDGGRNYLLVYFSADGVYAADTWHQTLDEAYSAAAEQFGVQAVEWGPPKST
jgi:hypothetical protein